MEKFPIRLRNRLYEPGNLSESEIDQSSEYSDSSDDIHFKMEFERSTDDDVEKHFSETVLSPAASKVGCPPQGTLVAGICPVTTTQDSTSTNVIPVIKVLTEPVIVPFSGAGVGTPPIATRISPPRVIIINQNQPIAVTATCGSLRRNPLDEPGDMDSESEIDQSSEYSDSSDDIHFKMEFERSTDDDIKKDFAEAALTTLPASGTQTSTGRNLPTGSIQTAASTMLSVRYISMSGSNPPNSGVLKNIAPVSSATGEVSQPGIAVQLPQMTISAVAASKLGGPPQSTVVAGICPVTTTQDTTSTNVIPVIQVLPQPVIVPSSGAGLGTPAIAPRIAPPRVIICNQNQPIAVTATCGPLPNSPGFQLFPDDSTVTSVIVAPAPSDATAVVFQQQQTTVEKVPITSFRNLLYEPGNLSESEIDQSSEYSDSSDDIHFKMEFERSTDDGVENHFGKTATTSTNVIPVIKVLPQPVIVQYPDDSTVIAMVAVPSPSSGEVLPSAAHPRPALQALNETTIVSSDTGGAVSATPIAQPHPPPIPTNTPYKLRGSSPRPSILRKRDYEGAPLKAQKNLITTFTNPVTSTPTAGVVPPVLPATPGESNGDSSRSSSGGSTTLSASSSSAIPPDNEEPVISYVNSSAIVLGKAYSNIQVKQKALDNAETSGAIASVTRMSSSAAVHLPNPPEVQMSPRKKPRKQQLLGQEFKEVRSSDDEMLAPLHLKDLKPENSVKSMPKEVATVVKRPRVSLISTYHQSWKARNRHFTHYSDVKLKDERRPTVTDLANKKQVLQKVHGWKVFHLSAQIEEMAHSESQIHERLSAVLEVMEKLGAGKNSERDLMRVNELIKGAFQRSKVISDGLEDSKNQLQKIFDHKPRAEDIIQRYRNKSPAKKREMK